MGFTLENLWPGGSNAANDFLSGKTGALDGFIKKGDGSWKAPTETNPLIRTRCFSNSGCPSGYACVGGWCGRADGSGGPEAPGGQGSGPGGRPGQCPDGPDSPCNNGGPDSCQTTPNCGEVPREDECCGQDRCCTFGSLSSFRPGVTCQCGECPTPSCTSFCDYALKSFGSESADCKGSSCDTCSECRYGQCEQITDGTAPCFCSGATACGDCEKCITDSESINFGDCEFLPYETNCQTCQTSYNYYCGCGKYLDVPVIACVPYGGNAWPEVHAKAAKLCEGACEPRKCEGSSNCFFYDSGDTGMPTCGEGKTQTGVIETDKGICVVCEECEPDTECECSMNSDCGHCEVCGSNCKCQPDTGCEYCEVDEESGYIRGKLKAVGAVAEWSGEPKGSGGPSTDLGVCGVPTGGISPFGTTLVYTGNVGATVSVQYYVNAGAEVKLTSFGTDLTRVRGCNTSKLPPGACFSGLPGGNTSNYIIIGGGDPVADTRLTYNPVNSANVSGTTFYSCTGYPTAAPRIIESRAFCDFDELPVTDPDDYSVYWDVLLNSYGDW